MSIDLQTELESARRAAGVSQQQLASRAGLSRMTVQRTESREIDPKLSTVIEMARALGMDVMLVPTVLRPDLENFVRSGGRYLAQPPGGDAPPSIVDTLIAK
ncbi:helix-turn-helix transcriptional regulator [Cupriavidus sp. BIS7]|uniref:helix-turn-helix transcriptional regulator n=1 Tax=Cupriavidus sp. BIS7 TaxID=1217718 RepID=UPI0002D87421|nr:helix-turn-helix transcriptional regulator [Cupriavidus sp. BIS7]